MVKSNDEGLLSVAPFLKKCYEMVDDDSTNSIISWAQNSESFVIWDMTQFSVQLLPKYFKHSNFSSFIRQLNIYGFRKVDTDRWEFANDGFVRGQKHLLKNIYRRKNCQSAENKKSMQQLENLQQQESSAEPGKNIEKVGLWKEVENLKIDKNVLMQELVKLRQYQETADNKLLLLRDRLQGMENNQKQMLSFLVMVVQNPSFLIQLLNSKENNWRMAEPGSIVEQDADETVTPSGGVIVKYQPPLVELPQPMQGQSKCSEKMQESNSSLDVMKDFFISPDFMKVLMDENLPFENHGAFALSELADDNTWEQLLLASPFGDSIDSNKNMNESSADADIEMETSVSGNMPCEAQDFELLLAEREKSNRLEKNTNPYGTHLECFDNMEDITKQMDLLASEMRTNSEKNSIHIQEKISM